MVIYGVSQSSGVERRLEVERVEPGVSLSIFNHAGGFELDRIVVSPADLLAAILEHPEGGLTIEGAASGVGSTKRLDVEVRRNEVQLKTRGDGEEEWDVAVGLDDFQDALEKVVD